MIRTVPTRPAYHIDALMAEGFSRRSIHWYVQIGLLPPPNSRGRYATYDDRHLSILRKVKRARDRRPLTLREIMDEVTV